MLTARPGGRGRRRGARGQAICMPQLAAEAREAALARRTARGVVAHLPLPCRASNRPPRLVSWAGMFSMDGRPVHGPGSAGCLNQPA